MTSSTLYYLFGRWGLFVMDFTFGGGGALAAYRGDLSGAAALTGAFIGLFGIAIWVHDRIAVVALIEGGVEVRSSDGTEHYCWGDVTSVSQVRQMVPPMYHVSFRKGHRSKYCVVADAYFFFEVMGFSESRDLTGFGEYAQAQILRASIEAEKARMVAERKR